jgi:hypothetical protein
MIGMMINMGISVMIVATETAVIPEETAAIIGIVHLGCRIYLLTNN